MISETRPSTTESAVPQRVIEPEILDGLQATDPRAQRARQDLRRINFWMGNAGIISSVLRRFCSQPPRRIIEIGAGDATLLLKIARRFPAWKNVHVTLIDQEPAIVPQTKAQYEALGWKVEVVRADVFLALSECPPCDLLLTNLFLHHFHHEQLVDLFEKVAQRTRLFVACEPRRTKFVPVARRLMWLIGCSDLTLHDAEISIRAGFFDGELTPLWPEQDRWELHERRAGFVSHLFVARPRS